MPEKWLSWDEAVKLAERADERDPYPREWCEAADLARELAKPRRKAPRFDIRCRPHDD